MDAKVCVCRDNFKATDVSNFIKEFCSKSENKNK